MCILSFMANRVKPDSARTRKVREFFDFSLHQEGIDKLKGVLARKRKRNLTRMVIRVSDLERMVALCESHQVASDDRVRQEVRAELRNREHIIEILSTRLEETGKELAKVEKELAERPVLREVPAPQPLNWASRHGRQIRRTA
jgi:hypothetical protein